MHRLDLGLYSHPKELGNGVGAHVNSKGEKNLYRTKKAGFNPHISGSQGRRVTLRPTSWSLSSKGETLGRDDVLDAGGATSCW